MKLTYDELLQNEDKRIALMSSVASKIVKDYYDPIIGAAQNDYMINMFQSESSIKRQLADGMRYFFVREADEIIGFICIYPRGDAMYLNKLYLSSGSRGKGFARSMIDFIISQSKPLDLSAIELNVNKNNPSKFIYEKLGFNRIRSEKNDIGSGFYMDDYVYRLDF